MAYEYDIRLTAVIEIGAKYTASTAEEARAMAELELRAHGQISDITVDRCIFLDDEDLPDAAYDPLPGPGF
jgi:hypothetical protein